jgi:hypothetical protein
LLAASGKKFWHNIKRPAILVNVGYIGKSKKSIPTQSQKKRRQVMKEYSTFVGMDVHKNSIEIA